MLRKRIVSSSFVLGWTALVFSCAFVSQAFSQTFPNRSVYYGGSVVGGVEVDAEGILRTVPRETVESFGKTIAGVFEAIPTDLNEEAPIRKISLKKLDAQLRELVAAKDVLPDAIRYMGGLTAIRFIVVNPEENDVLLIGPAEGWKIDAYGNVLGKRTGRPVLRLEDFLTLYRTWNKADGLSVITCSIDPTPDAMRKLAEVDRKFGVIDQRNVRAYASAQEDAMGNNVVSLQGIPKTSRFASVLVAADYRMKRIGLGHDASPLRTLPSYTSLISGSQKQRTPRFWLAPEYGAITHDSKKLTWQLGNLKVKALTEDEFVDSRGARQSSSRPDRAAINWCTRMTNNYDALCKVEPVFGDLKNCMELAMVVALIQRENLLEKAGCAVPTIAKEKLLEPDSYPVPKMVPAEALIVSGRRAPLVACGGVEINPFATVEKASLNSKIDAEYEKLSETEGASWWSK